MEYLNGINHLEAGFSLFITGNDRLTSLEGWENVTSTTVLKVSGNLNLASLSDLISLTFVGEILSIEDQPLFVLLSGLENAESTSDLRIRILRNEGLTDFCDLQNILLSENLPLEQIIIGQNGFDPSAQDVIDGNCSL